MMRSRIASRATKGTKLRRKKAQGKTVRPGMAPRFHLVFFCAFLWLKVNASRRVPLFTPFRLIRVAAVLALALAAASTAYSQTKLLRFPDIRGDRVVFTYGGDLWTAPSSGGMATRLTSHPGVELFAKFSPDGKWIAFTGQYDGDEQVYVVRSEERRVGKECR